MKKSLPARSAAALLIAMLLHSTAFATASGSMRCKGGIVSLGDTAGKVMGSCGQPAFTTQRERKESTATGKGSKSKSATTVTIDDWTFNFGPNEFQYRVVMENGVVTGIESLDYGY